jgi:multidrug efflux pump subunit AcrA (membrane-fusion protein)
MLPRSTVVRRSAPRFPPGGSCRHALPTVVAAALGACSGVSGSPVQDRNTAVVARRTVEDVFLLTGELQAVRSEQLTVPRVEGFRVQVKRLAEDGSEVQAGQTVAELDNSQVAQSLEEMRLRLTQAQIALEGKEASLEAEASQKRFELEKADTEAAKARIEAAVPAALRSRKEWNDKQQALRRAEVALDKARLALRAFEQSSRADVELLRIARDKAARDVEQAEDSLRHLSLVTPKAGIVVLGRPPNEDRPLRPGDTLWPGWPVAAIPDLSAMEVVALLSDVDEGRLAPGQSARVALETDLGRHFAGRVEEVGAVAEDARYAGGFKVRVSLERTDPALMRPGLSARVEVVRRVFEKALVVPRHALVRGDGKVRVRRAGSTELLEVALAACLPLECVVQSGLSEGERVALR